MSKERARRRAEREREQALQAAARAAEAERRERREARRRALTSRLPAGSAPRPAAGTLAARKRQQTGLLIAVLALVTVLAWLAFDGWAARALALVVALFALPVAHTLFVRR